MELSCDPLWFPIIRFGERNRWMSFLPITRVQFEHFLCDPKTPVEYSGNWYEQNMPSLTAQGRPRLGIHMYQETNYFDCFLRNLDPIDGVNNLTNWYDQCFPVHLEIIGSRLPRDEEWVACYRSMATQPPLAESQLKSLGLSWRASAILRRLWSLSPKWNSLAEQMFLVKGVFEWSKTEDKLGYRGCLHPTLSKNVVDHIDPSAGAPRPGSGARDTHGFRLVFEFPHGIELSAIRI